LIAHPGGVGDNRGWARAGQTHTVQLVFDDDEAAAFRQSNPDCKETLELGNPFSSRTTVPPNKWIPEHLLPGFRNFVESWWADCAVLADILFRSLSEALQIRDEGYFSRMHLDDDSHVSWNFYPAMPLQTLRSTDAKRLNPHTDFGTLTILFQDAVGGLEVHDGHRFRPVTPVPGTIVVNVGDMLEQQSNGRWKSALHRVVAPGQLMKPGTRSEQVSLHANARDGDGNGGEVLDRYSLAYFGVPNPDEMIKIAPGCEEPGKWRPNMNGDWGTLTARQWIEKRLAVDLGQSVLIADGVGG
jgi:isopenicillin N synthase-like dioxygenase